MRMQVNFIIALLISCSNLSPLIYIIYLDYSHHFKWKDKVNWKYKHLKVLKANEPDTEDKKEKQKENQSWILKLNRTNMNTKDTIDPPSEEEDWRHLLFFTLHPPDIFSPTVIKSLPCSKMFNGFPLLAV